MTGILRKLCQISGMLEMLASMGGCTITPGAVALIGDAVKALDSVEDELIGQEEAREQQ